MSMVGSWFSKLRRPTSFNGVISDIRDPYAQSSQVGTSSRSSKYSKSFEIDRKPGNLPAMRHSEQKITAEEVRALRELIRYRYTLDTEIWCDRDVEAYDRPAVLVKMAKSDAALRTIEATTECWTKREYFESDEDFYKMQEIRIRILERGKRLWDGHPPWTEHEEPTSPWSTASSSSVRTSSFAGESSSLNTSNVDPSTMPTTPRWSFDSTTARSAITDSDQTDASNAFEVHINDDDSEGLYNLRTWGAQNDITEGEYEILTLPSTVPSARGRKHQHGTKQAQTLPEPDIVVSEAAEDEIDLSRAEEDDLDYLFNPTSYFAALDDLELEVARICELSESCIETGEHITLIKSNAEDSLNESNLDRVIGQMANVRRAFALLERDGFSKSKFNILVQDSERLESTGTPIAKVVAISSVLLTQLERVGQEAKPLVKKYNLSRAQETAALYKWCRVITDLLESIGFILPKPTLDDGSQDKAQVCLRLFDTATSLLKLSLLSYTGSHSCPFDETVFKRVIFDLCVGSSYTFRRRKLKCLDDFIGGPVWVWEKKDIGEKDYLLSIKLEDFVDLWGPVRLTSAEGPIVSSTIHTARGVIHPIAPGTTQGGEIQCHYFSDPDHVERDVIGNGSIDTTTPLLIGMVSPVSQLLPSSFFNVNEQCSGNWSTIEERHQNLLKMAGVCRPHSEHAQTQLGLAAGQYITPSFVMIWKRYPGIAWGDIILMSFRDERKPLFKLLTFLRQKVGLEISSCTFNAQRISLWEAMTLRYLGLKSQPHQSTCNRSVGAYECIRDCWGFVPARGGDTADTVREAIQETLEELKYTGFDKAGDFKAWWPFSQDPKTLQIRRSQEGRSGNWIGLLKNTVDVATYAVMSNQCLEYEYSKPKKDEKLCLSRRCSSSLKANESNTHLQASLHDDRSVRTDHTLLGTRLVVFPMTVVKDDAECLEETLLSPLGTRLGVKKLGILTIANEDRPQLAHFEKSFVPRLGGKVTATEYLMSEEPKGLLRVIIA